MENGIGITCERTVWKYVGRHIPRRACAACAWKWHQATQTRPQQAATAPPALLHLLRPPLPLHSACTPQPVTTAPTHTTPSTTTDGTGCLQHWHPNHHDSGPWYTFEHDHYYCYPYICYASYLNKGVHTLDVSAVVWTGIWLQPNGVGSVTL